MVVKYAGIAGAVEPFRPAAPFPHIHNHFHGFPGLSAIGTAAHADVDVFLKVFAVVVPDIVYGNQGAGICGD